MALPYLCSGSRQRISHRVASRIVAIGLVFMLFPNTGHSAESPAQQRCISDMNRLGSRVAKVQGAVAVLCLRDAARGNTDKLGNPPQEQTAQACLTNDVRGKVWRRTRKVIDFDLDRCLARPEQRPDFGYTDAATVNAAAQAAILGIMEDLFDAELDLAVVPEDNDSTGAKCQREVAKRANRLFDTMWREALLQKKNVLKGNERRTGTDPNAPVESGAVLAAEIPLYVQEDPRVKTAKAILKLTDLTQRRCQDALTPIAEMFPGVCAASSSLTELADCAARNARARFYNSLAAFDDLDIDCDLLDDGTADGSCIAPALKQHVLNRIGYGPDEWSLGRLDELGVDGYIQEQLDPETIDDSALDALLALLPSLTMSFNELRANYPRGGSPGRGRVRRELQFAKMARAIASRRQLKQVLVDFWFNHFNVDATSSGRTQWDISPYERIAIRPHVLGRFEDLLLANARSPAMGDYLDNRRNRVGAINENYGREIMELHTLGVDGDYDESDVVAVSRCFTGWRENYNNEVDGFWFRASWHDEDPKTIFGGALEIAANGGEQDGIDVVQYLAAHTNTASGLARKLVKRFVNEDPPASLVEAAADAYLNTGGDIRAVMERILFSFEFLEDPTNRGNKVKRPHHLMASVARALGADPSQVDYNDLRRNSRDMGESLYEAGPPTGYPDASGFWASPGTLITRFNQIERRARRRAGFVFTYPISSGTSEEIVAAWIEQLFAGGVSDDTRDTTIAFLDVLADVLAVPDTERIEQAAALLMSSPEFLQH